MEPSDFLTVIDIMELAYLHWFYFIREDYIYCNRCLKELNRRLNENKITLPDVNQILYYIETITHYDVNCNGFFNKIIESFDISK